jgi:hypothetical protein
MPKSKKLQKQIEKKLDQLSKLLDKIDEARIINSDDPDTWDPDTLYNLVENCKEVSQFLEDKEDPKKRNEFGEPIILEEGLCSLMDEYHEEDEDENSEEF